jgi:lipopolysaccharide export LptBFGC system permease protein LptF
MYVFTTIATTGFSFPPVIAIWIPNIIFSFVALYFYKTAQK